MSQYQQGDPVNEARLLIPWYITGKLSEPERKLVASMLEQHPDLKEDYLRELRTVELIRSNDSLLQLTAVDTTQQRLDKLLKRIQREEETGAAGVTPSAMEPPPGKKTVAAAGWAAFFRGLLPSMEWLTPANAVLASLLLLQAGFAGWFAHSSLTESAQEKAYLTAEYVDGSNAVPVVNGMVLLVEFNENAQIRQVREFLNKWNARMLDGPDANNLFKIEIKDVSASDQRSDAVLLQMQQDTSVISFVGRKF
ncbi:MAG: hypothetical protein KJ914_04370 [Gammaproteobacteria bacterium]|nr:hypothetical protein [Gammaproteobacteria bacterium]MBU1725488.1 hypothetical protein [Gammaproteobacteria bacterium]MBU2005555.1 hypothetical protein [Gammaproteobacteria bacterium]